MTNNKHQKLELTWIGKGEEPKLEPRILIEQPEYSYWVGKEQGVPSSIGGGQEKANMLIHGDNLLALKALEQDYAGKVKCIYIDPPFNTGAAFEHYDDGIEHSIWLNLMNRRINILHTLLARTGSIFIHLDDNEVDYCKLILDSIFGRDNFINRITVEARSPSAFSTVNPGVFKSSEYILWYAKDKQNWESRSMRIPSQRDTAYNKYIINRDEDETQWIFSSLKQAFLEDLNQDRLDQIEVFLKQVYDNGRGITRSQLSNLIMSIFPLHLLFKLKLVTNYLWTKLKIESYEEFWSSVYIYMLEKCSYNYNEKELDEFVFNNSNSVFRETEISDDGAGQEIVDLKYKSLELQGSVLKLERGKGLDTVYVLNGKQISFYKKNVEYVDGKLTSTRLLTNVWNDISWEGIAGEGGVKFKKGKKPEKILKRCIELTSNKGDLILDSFLGSGTTAAVAHKLKRRWIGIELGEHAITHCIPRLKSVILGDQTGISKSVGWKGGGEFTYYTLAPSLLNQDKFGNWVISSEYNAQMLAAATAKQEGFRFNPHETLYWKQGNSSENDYIFTTTQFITVETLDQIHDAMLQGESLMICCKAFQKECKSKYANITIKKIPQMLLGRCEFGKDDYSLNIVNMPVDDQPVDVELNNSGIESVVLQRTKKDKRSIQEISKNNHQTLLFD